MKKTDIHKAMDTLKGELQKDTDYRRSWEDNISISFQDEFNQQISDCGISHTVIKSIADKAAARFLNSLTGRL